MKAFIGGTGAVLMYLTGLLFCLFGLLMMNTMWGIVGVLIGIIVFPLPFVMGMFAIFASWSAFFGWMIWFALIGMMIYIGKDE